jgi:hypothetical protein
MLGQAVPPRRAPKNQTRRAAQLSEIAHVRADILTPLLVQGEGKLAQRARVRVTVRCCAAFAVSTSDALVELVEKIRDGALRDVIHRGPQPVRGRTRND